MSKRRSRGDGGLHWDDSRQRWIATASLGYDPSGKRMVKRASGRTKTAAKERLKEVLRDYEDGLAIAPTGYTVGQAVNDWLTYGLTGRDKSTIDTCTYLSTNGASRPVSARPDAANRPGAGPTGSVGRWSEHDEWGPTG